MGNPKNQHGRRDNQAKPPEVVLVRGRSAARAASTTMVPYTAPAILFARSEGESPNVDSHNAGLGRSGVCGYMSRQCTSESEWRAS